MLINSGSYTAAKSLSNSIRILTFTGLYAILPQLFNLRLQTFCLSQWRSQPVGRPAGPELQIFLTTSSALDEKTIEYSLYGRALQIMHLFT